MRARLPIALACLLALAGGYLQASQGRQQPTTALGYGNLLADLGWLHFVQYYGDAARKQSGYGQSYRYLEAITASDPRFERAYLFALGAVAERTARPDLAEQLLARGLQADPLSPVLWQSRGLLHWMYTGDIRQAARSFRRAAAVVKAGNAAQNEANHWLLLSRMLGCLPPSSWSRHKIWREIYDNAADSETRRRAVIELAALGVEIAATGTLQRPPPPPPAYRQYFLYGPQKQPERSRTNRTATARMNACFFARAQP